MNQIEFDSAPIPTARRLRYWQDLVGDHLADVDMRQPKQVSSGESYGGSMSLLTHPRVTFAKVRSANQLLLRTPSRIRRAERETVLLNVMISGECHLEQEGRRACLQPGDLCIYESVRPYEITTPGEFEVLVVMADRAFIEAKFGNLRMLTGHRIAHTAPTAAIARAYWHSFAQQAANCTDSEIDSLVAAGFEILKPALRSISFSDGDRTAGALLAMQRAKIYMKENFYRSALSPAEVAQATGLSLRRLQELFQDEGLTINGYLQNLRLQMACHDLADRTLSRMPVASITERAGFTDQSHFSRAFRKAYGQSPRTWRRTRRQV